MTTVFGTRQDHITMTVQPARGDTDNVRTFFFQHLAIVGISSRGIEPLRRGGASFSVFISHGDVAKYCCVACITDPDVPPHKGQSIIVVEQETPGFNVGKKEDKMGIRASSTCELIFEDCRVPAQNLLGAENEGFAILMKTLDFTRVPVAIQAVGIAQGALDEALNYAHSRVQFGKPISSFQGIQFMLADMATQIEAARALVYAVSRMIDSGAKRFSKESAMAKLMASDVAMWVTTDAVQIFGGYGYMKDYPVEKMMRDAKITQIYEGTNQIQREVIALQLVKESLQKKE